jgi:hypothetical protein
LSSLVQRRSASPRRPCRWRTPQSAGRRPSASSCEWPAAVAAPGSRAGGETCGTRADIRASELSPRRRRRREHGRTRGERS